MTYHIYINIYIYVFITTLCIDTYIYIIQYISIHIIQYKYLCMYICCIAGGHAGLHQHDAACCLLSILVPRRDSTDSTIIRDVWLIPSGKHTKSY